MKEFWEDYKEPVLSIFGILLIVVAFKIFSVVITYLDKF